MTENPPPLKNGRPVKLKFASQVSVSPPKFNIFSNHPREINNQYKKYLSNKLKKSFHLEDIPIKVRFKKQIIHMNKISFYFILFFSISLFADEDQTINLIVENCKSCHNLNIETTKKIPSINNLEKDEFVRLMKKYKNDKDNSVMNRISKVLTNNDILKMADKIYGKK